jgi:hypothetical protein
MSKPRATLCANKRKTQRSTYWCKCVHLRQTWYICSQLCPYVLHHTGERLCTSGLVVVSPLTLPPQERRAFDTRVSILVGSFGKNRNVWVFGNPTKQLPSDSLVTKVLEDFKLVMKSKGVGVGALDHVREELAFSSFFCLFLSFCCPFCSHLGQPLVHKPSSFYNIVARVARSLKKVISV